MVCSPVRGAAASSPGGDGHIFHHPHNHRVLVHVTADRICSVEKFAREGLVDDGHVLRIRAVSIGEGAPEQDRDLQCLEITGGDVYLIRFNLLACFFAVADGQRSVDQGALIRQTQADSGMLHAGNLPHGGRALVQQLSEGRGIVETDVVERGLGDHHSSWD